MNFDQGVLSRYFFTDAKAQVCEFDDPLILLYDGKYFPSTVSFDQTNIHMPTQVTNLPSKKKTHLRQNLECT